MIIVGKISVKAIVENQKRDIEKIYLMDKLRNNDVRYIRNIAKGIPIEIMSREELTQISGVDNHGGYAISCSKRKNDDIYPILKNKTISILLVEGMRDPFNMGEIFRTALAMGFDAIISSEYDFYDNEKIVVRSSAGASEKLLWHQSSDLEKTIATLKEKDVSIVAAHRADNNSVLGSYQFSDKVCICIGGALRGLSTKVLEHADEFVRIDYDAKIALSTVASCNIFTYERFRQQGERK